MNFMITENYKTIVPAYGRDYTSKAKAELDFREGKDFDLRDFNSSGYCSIKDFAPGNKG